LRRLDAAVTQLQALDSKGRPVAHLTIRLVPHGQTCKKR
jgi:hypothetical protein